MTAWVCLPEVVEYILTMLLFCNQEGCQTGDSAEKWHTRRTLGTVTMYMRDGAKATRDGVGHLGKPSKYMRTGYGKGMGRPHRPLLGPRW